MICQLMLNMCRTSTPVTYITQKTNAASRKAKGSIQTTALMCPHARMQSNLEDNECRLADEIEVVAIPCPPFHYMCLTTVRGKSWRLAHHSMHAEGVRRMRPCSGGARGSPLEYMCTSGNLLVSCNSHLQPCTCHVPRFVLHGFYDAVRIVSRAKGSPDKMGVYCYGHGFTWDTGG
jgi:hypothetical protein